MTLNPNKDKEFWNYSFHEMGLYDLPAVIKHIKADTGVDKITYIGHSQGTSQMFAGITLLPDFYKENINGFIALGPVTNLQHVNSTLLKKLVDFRADQILDIAGIFHELLADTESLRIVETFLCQKIGLLCDGVLELIADFNLFDDDLDRFPVFLAHFPSGSSLKTLLHFAQNIRHKNFATYGDMKPYDFSKVKDIPVALFVGDEDRLATVEDNRILKDVLEKNNLLNFYKEYEHTGHVGFFISLSNIFMEDVVRKVDEFSKLI